MPSFTPIQNTRKLPVLCILKLVQVSSVVDYYVMAFCGSDSLHSLGRSWLKMGVERRSTAVFIEFKNALVWFISEESVTHHSHLIRYADEASLAN
jgi:hypothetical protein